jgi:hypothetical protein
MERICIQCSTAFVVAPEDRAFLDRVSPVFNGKKEQIPPPTLCPECRLQRRLCYRNPLYVYFRTSDTNGKPVFSAIPEGAPYRIMDRTEWFSDHWDAISYGREVDLSRSVLAQFGELCLDVPPLCNTTLNLENSDYCNNASEMKNCYLVFDAFSCEDSLYCEGAAHLRDCVDCNLSTNSELCYDCTTCDRCYNLQSSQFCVDCQNSFFLTRCTACSDCFGCANLRHKRFCIFNEQKTEEEYRSFLRELNLSSFAQRAEWKARADALALSMPVPHMETTSCEQVTGNHLREAQNIHQGFFIFPQTSNVRYGYAIGFQAHDCMDYSCFGTNAELLYECMVCGMNVRNLLFCNECWLGDQNLIYCSMCNNCSDCFGCVGLQRKAYCIFNKQYTKEEYEALVPRIIERMRADGEWGEFLPASFARVPYNRSLAQRFFPLTKEQCDGAGLWWYEDSLKDMASAIDAAMLPDGLPLTDDMIIVKSSISHRPFKITSQELKRYRQFQVPLPRITYDERMEERAKKNGGVRLYERTCMKTGKPILTTYTPDSPWIVWEKSEYDKEYGF